MCVINKARIETKVYLSIELGIGTGVCHGDNVNRPCVAERRTVGSVWRRERKKLAVRCVTLHTALTGV